MANVSVNVAKKTSLLSGLQKMFAVDSDPIKELMKKAVKMDPIYYLPSSESVETLYTIGKKLGEGAFGSVYSAVRNSDKKLVALKYMNTRNIIYFWDKKDEDEGTPMEIYVHRKLNNIPGVVELLDVYLTHGGGGYVLILDQPSPPVKDLYEYARGKFVKINDAQARNIVGQVINILIDVMEAGIYHQDVKHENLLFQPKTGKVYLIDFGAAQLVEQAPYTSFYGTDSCQPVEMLTSGSCLPEPATVWSIGILAFRLMAGRFPFRTNEEILEGKLNFTERCTTDLRDFVSACLTTDPSTRPTLSDLLGHAWLTQDQTIHKPSKSGISNLNGGL